MNGSIRWSLALTLMVGATWMAWLAPIAHGEEMRTPHTIRSVAPPPTGVNIGNCSVSPCATIGYAISQSSGGDQINVASGWYTEHITMTNGVSIYGQGWGTWTGTVITGNFSANQPTVYIPESVGAGTVLSGVQAAGGGTGNPSTSSNGGGIYCNGAPTIINTWVNNNTGYYGGGVYVGYGSPTLKNVAAWNNRAVYGGGFYFNSVVVTFASDFVGTHGTIYQNTATNSGGGFYIVDSSVNLSGLRIFTNTASFGGGGIRFERSTGLFKSNWLLSNVVTSTTGFGGGAEVSGSSTGVIIEGNWFDDNSAPASWSEGGGLNVRNSASASVNGNMFLANTAPTGGGIHIGGATAVTITNNIIVRNVVSSTSAGGMRVSGTPGARVINNTISDNVGTGLYFRTSDGILIVNNIFSGNGDHGIEREGATVYTFDYNDVWSNGGGNYSNVAVGTHDLSVNPSFIGSGNLFNYYHLQATSPVSKTGFLIQAPPYDIDGQRRVICTSMGADQICSQIYFLPLISR